VSSTTLVAVAGGEVYERYAERMMVSAERFFRPSKNMNFVVLKGEEGWPNGTMMRYHRLLENLPATENVFMVDADMLFVDHIGDEVISRFGVTATRHPGYVGKPTHELPYERREQSAAYVAPNEGGTYYCGGFIGGKRLAMKVLAQHIVKIIDADATIGTHPEWHDESAINRILATYPPETTLTPSYCYPADDSYYKTFWTESYIPRLVALDKSEDERGER